MSSHTAKRSRFELQEILEKIMNSDNVYFQPPENIKLRYPCIIYNKSDEDQRYADDLKYLRFNVYEIVLIDYDPDSPFQEDLSDLQYCTFDRFYVSDNLNHFSYRLYF